MRESTEHWKVVEEFPAYSVSSCGRVRRDTIFIAGGGAVQKPKGILATRALPSGHRRVTLCMGNRPRTFLVHRLVALAFLPAPSPGKDCVCHKDDNPSNNCADNLFWGTKADNSADMVRKQRQKIGTEVHGAKLDADKVRDIRRRISSGQSQAEVAAVFGIAQSNVYLIANGKTWSHVR